MRSLSTNVRLPVVKAEQTKKALEVPHWRLTREATWRRSHLHRRPPDKLVHHDMVSALGDLLTFQKQLFLGQWDKHTD